MKVRGENGVVIDVPASIASGLVGGVNHRCEYVVDDSPARPAVAPKPYASKAEWVEYAVTRGVPQDEANALSKTNLIAQLESA